MFYDEDSIKNALNCQKCNEKLDEARNLPCGSIICLSCTAFIKIDTNHNFKCLLCTEKHAMPLNGLPLNKIVSLFLSLEPKEVYRGQAAENLKSSLEEIEQKLKQISFSLKTGIDEIKEYFINLRIDVQLATEEAIRQIHMFNEELINEIDQIERNCLASIESNEKINLNLGESAILTELFHSKWKQYLNQTLINDESIVDANKTAETLILNLNADLAALEQIKFNGFKIKFEKYPFKLSKSLLGSFKFEIQSSILTNVQMSDLMNLCGLGSAKSWSLQYRATRDGFGGMDFHDKCDKKKNTFIIIKSTNDNVFGGYHWL